MSDPVDQDEILDVTLDTEMEDIHRNMDCESCGIFDCTCVDEQEETE